MYGFKQIENTPIEIGYDLNCKERYYHILVERKGYPFTIYEKHDLDGNLIELYPLYLESAKRSLEILKDEKPYNGTFDLSRYAYLSWDLKSEEMNEIYLPGKSVIKKYKNDTVETTYFQYKTSSINNVTGVPKEIKKFIKSKKPDYFILAWKSNKLYKFILMYNYQNSEYINIKTKFLLN